MLLRKMRAASAGEGLEVEGLEASWK